MTIRARLGIALLVALVAPGSVQAQATTVAASCTERWSTLGALGITEFTCDCTFDPSNTPAWRFRGEPEVGGVAAGGPAAGRLRPGDVIVAIDGMLITTRAAGARLARLDPATPVTLTIRRGNREMDVRIVPEKPCEPPTPPVPPAAEAPVTGAPSTATPRTPRTVSPPVGAPASPDIPVPATPPGPSGWFGFGISCHNCELNTINSPLIARAQTELRSLRNRYDDHAPEVRAARARLLALRREGVSWKFSEYPTLFSVDPGSPASNAGLRRGDVLLKVDGVSLLTPEGARRFGQVEPGQSVSLTYRRGGSERTVRIRAVEPPAGSLSSGEGVVEALAELERAQVERAQELERLGETVSRAGAAREPIERELAQVRQQLERLSTTHSVESAAQLNRLREELALVEESRAARLAPLAESQHLRFAGSVGNTEVEVRGLSSVVVSYDESTGELLIRTMDSTIRVKAPAPTR